MQVVMEDSEREYNRMQEQWEGMDEMIAMSADGEVCVPKLDVEEVVEDEPPLTVWNHALVGQW